MTVDRPVILSLEDVHGERCADIVADADGTFRLKVYRRDAEDGGRWTLVADYGATRYRSLEEARIAARARLPWLA